MQIREALVMAIAEIQLILADSQPFGNYTSFFFHLGGPSQKRLFFLIFDRSPNLNECADDLRDCAELKPYSLAITRRIDEVQRSFPKRSVDSQSGSFLRVVFSMKARPLQTPRLPKHLGQNKHPQKTNGSSRIPQFCKSPSCGEPCAIRIQRIWRGGPIHSVFNVFTYFNVIWNLTSLVKIQIHKYNVFGAGLNT